MLFRGLTTNLYHVRTEQKQKALLPTKTFIYIGEYLIFDLVSVEKGYFRINDIQFEACYFLLNILKMF